MKVLREEKTDCESCRRNVSKENSEGTKDRNSEFRVTRLEQTTEKLYHIHYKVRMQEVQPEQTSYKRQVLGCIVSKFNEKKRSFFCQKSGRFQFWLLPELVKCRCTLQIYFSRCCWKLPRSIIVRLLFHGCLLQLPEIPRNCPKSAIFGNHCMTSLSNIDTFWVGTFWLRDLSCLSPTFGK